MGLDLGMYGVSVSNLTKKRSSNDNIINEINKKETDKSLGGICNAENCKDIKLLEIPQSYSSNNNHVNSRISNNFRSSNYDEHSKNNINVNFYQNAKNSIGSDYFEFAKNNIDTNYYEHAKNNDDKNNYNFSPDKTNTRESNYSDRNEYRHNNHDDSHNIFNEHNRDNRRGQQDRDISDFFRNDRDRPEENSNFFNRRDSDPFGRNSDPYGRNSDPFGRDPFGGRSDRNEYNRYDGGYNRYDYDRYDSRSDSNSLSQLASLLDPSGLDDCVRIFRQISDKFPSEVKYKLFDNAVDIKKIATKSLEIPEYTKALSHSNIAINILKQDPFYPVITKKQFGRKDSIEIDMKKLGEQKIELEKFLNDFKKNHQRNNLTQDVKEEIYKKVDDLEKIQMLELAMEFKKINLHNLRKTMAEIGIRNIRIAGDTYFIEMDNKLGNILKISSTVTSLGVQVLDKVWKIRNFKTDDAENKELTPQEFINVGKIVERREMLVIKQADTMFKMLKHLVDKDSIDTPQAKVVESLLRGFYCKPSEVVKHLEGRHGGGRYGGGYGGGYGGYGRNDSGVYAAKEYLLTGMNRLYKF